MRRVSGHVRRALRLWAIAVLAVAVTVSVLVLRTPGEAKAATITGDGRLIISASAVNVTLSSVDAAFNNGFGLQEAEGVIKDIDIFGCLDVSPGFTQDLGTFGPGELMFRLKTPDAGDIPFEGEIHGNRVYFTGPASRNPDNVVHALLSEVAPDTVRISWEDLFGFGGGDPSYDDCVVDVQITELAPTTTATATSTSTPTPTATSTSTPTPTAKATNTPTPTATSTSTPKATATATPSAAVLGVVQVPQGGGEPGGSKGKADDGWLLALGVALVAGGALSIATGRWYARRRRPR